MKELEKAIQEVLKKTKKNKLTFLTGAGISAESGIPTYRGNDGIWVKGTKFHKPEEFGTYAYFKENPEEVWQFALFRKKMFEEAKPNSSHFNLVKIEELLSERFHLITQNIDNLHRKAGNKNIYEIHGNLREVKCSMGCKSIYPISKNLVGKKLTEELDKSEIDALKCPECGAWLRPNILWFDEYYDEKTNKIESSLKVAKNTGILFIIGTSGATNLPLQIAGTVAHYGNFLVDINIKDSFFTSLMRNYKRKIALRETSSQALANILDIISNYCT